MANFKIHLQAWKKIGMDLLPILLFIVACFILMRTTFYFISKGLDAIPSVFLALALWFGIPMAVAFFRDYYQSKIEEVKRG